MSDPVWLSVVGAVQAVALAVIAAWLKRSQDLNHVSTQKSIEEVRLQTNGRMDQLLNVTGEAEHAKGIIEGNTAARTEDDLVKVAAAKAYLKDRKGGN